MANQDSADPRQPSVPIPCQRSGRCCQMMVTAGCLDVSDEDVARWEQEGRADILCWVSMMRTPSGEIAFADFPVPPDGDDDAIDRCPFLEWEDSNAVCTIHDTKPSICAVFHCVTQPFRQGRAYELAVERGLIEPDG